MASTTIVIILILWVVLTAFITFWGFNREIGERTTLLICIFLSPLIASIVVSNSRTKAELQEAQKIITLLSEIAKKDLKSIKS